jgi:hypothetical protein
VLRQCGAPQLPASAVPAGAKVFEVPLLSISAADTTVIGFLVSRCCWAQLLPSAARSMRGAHEPA